MRALSYRAALRVLVEHSAPIGRIEVFKRRVPFYERLRACPPVEVTGEQALIARLAPREQASPGLAPQRGRERMLRSNRIETQAFRGRRRRRRARARSGSASQAPEGPPELQPPLG